MNEKKSDGKPIGIDIGTSKIVVAQKKNGRINFPSQRNAFLSVEHSRFTEGILLQNKIHHYRNNGSLVLYGEGAEIFANMLNTETRRPMRDGLLNPKEGNAIEIIKGILDDLIPKPKFKGTPLCFSVPGMPARDSTSDPIYHEAILKQYLTEKGYKAKGINEGMAVVFSELEEENFTGLGISVGGGMCNVCLSFLSVPVVTFSIKKAGDYVDDAVASVTGEVNTRIRKIKENGFSLDRRPRNEIEEALNIFYDDLIKTLMETIKECVSENSKVPKFDKPIPIVLSGGSVMPEGFRQRFEMFIQDQPLPLDIKEVRLADEPLHATARGAYIASMYDD